MFSFLFCCKLKGNTELQGDSHVEVTMSNPLENESDNDED